MGWGFLLGCCGRAIGAQQKFGELKCSQALNWGAVDHSISLHSLNIEDMERNKANGEWRQAQDNNFNNTTQFIACMDCHAIPQAHQSFTATSQLCKRNLTDHAHYTKAL
jgi:hypothetical protein